MSQIADVKCVIFQLAYLEALDTLYQMECNSTEDLEALIVYDYRASNSCTDADEDCCIREVLRKYSYTTTDCGNTADCSGVNIYVDITPCGDITITS